MRVVVVSTVHALTRFPIVLLCYLAGWTVTLVVTLDCYFGCCIGCCIGYYLVSRDCCWLLLVTVDCLLVSLLFSLSVQWYYGQAPISRYPTYLIDRCASPCTYVKPIQHHYIGASNKNPKLVIFALPHYYCLIGRDCY